MILNKRNYRIPPINTFIYGTNVFINSNDFYYNSFYKLINKKVIGSDFNLSDF